MNFQLEYWWILPLLLLVGMLIIGGFVFYHHYARRPKATPNTVLVANSIRVRQSNAYQQALKKLWVQLITAGVVVGLLAIIASLGATRLVSVSVEHPEKHNRDIALCLDASGSMFDVNIDILEKFSEMVDGFQGERISLTVFNATAMQVFPLTDDYDYIQENLQKVVTVFEKNYEDPETAAYLASTMGREEGASLIGDGLYGCSLSFDYKEDENRSRSIILATDNVLNGTELVPLDEAANLVSEQNIRVYGINPGSRGNGISFVPESSITTMQEAVEATGGKFFLLDDTTAVGTIVDEISATETSMVRGNPIIIKHDNPELVMYLIAGLLVTLTGLAVWRKL